MRDARFSGFLAASKAHAVAAHLDGAVVEVYDGERPEHPEDNVSTQVLLARLELPDPAVEEITSDGAVVIRPPDAVPALASGTPTWFRCLTSFGTLLFDGTVGPRLDPLLEAYDMFVDGPVEADGEFEVTRFVYVERRL